MSQQMTARAAPTTREIQDWLVAWVACEAEIDVAAIDVEDSFVNFGLSSRQAVLLSGDLEDWLGRPLSESLAWDYPTIAKLAAHLGTPS
jgi:acyl carrier protein